MGLLGPSRAERHAAAARADQAASRETRTARQLRAEAAQLRHDDKRNLNADPGAVREITGNLESNARIADLNARDLRGGADHLRRR